MSSPNSWIIVFRSLYSFFFQTKENILELFGKNRTAQATQAYTTIDELMNQGPHAFYQKPTGIKIGRALFTFLLNFFQYEQNTTTHKK